MPVFASRGAATHALLGHAKSEMYKSKDQFATETLKNKSIKIKTKTHVLFGKAQLIKSGWARRISFDFVQRIFLEPLNRHTFASW